MTYTRRKFIQRTGIAIAALVMARCAPTVSKSDTPRDRLRDCWLLLLITSGAPTFPSPATNRRFCLS
jgi:hypothetical protein